MPPNAEIGNLSIRYTFDQNLGFLGGPYTPMVTTELSLPDFEFISPVGAFVGLFGANGPVTLVESLTYSNFSVSLPAEDLAQGD